jgi:hypothetical protein
MQAFKRVPVAVVKNNTAHAHDQPAWDEDICDKTVESSLKTDTDKDT